MKRQTNRRVVVTGMGALTAIGNDVNTLWENAKSGIHGFAPLTLFDTTHMKVKIGGEVKHLNLEGIIEPREAKRMDRSTQLGVAAAYQAYHDANLVNATINPYRFATYMASGIGGLGTIYEESKKAHERGGDRVSPFFIPAAIINLIGGNIAIKFQAKGPAIPVVTACSAATNAIGEAFHAIRDGYVDLAFAGGAEAPINDLGVGGFSAMKALNMSNDVNNASIPFDAKRSGFVIAEGAGVLILEELEHALARKAKIHGEIIGYGTTCDAYHITAPDETAEGIAACIQMAIDDANIKKESVDHINPHGTSTPLNDKYETLGIKKVFQEHAKRIVISGTKSMHGHALGAVGGIEAIITLKALQEGICPPTINLRDPDEDCDLDYTPNVAIIKEINIALSNSVGFGGQNATIILKKWEASNHDHE